MHSTGLNRCRVIMESIKLTTGADMPLLGLGTWLSKPGQVEAAVEHAIKTGYRLIDTAWIYGNEKEIGNAVKKCIADGVVKREDLFITTKLWTTYHRRGDVKVMLKKSLENLQMSYVDLYLIHLPTAMVKAKNSDIHAHHPDGKIVYEHVDLVETWQGMEDSYNQGLAKAIGVSNFNAAQIQNIYDHATVKPHNQQVEVHGYFPQFEMQEFCTKHGISVTSYGPLGSPGRGEFIKDKKDPGNQLEDSVVTEIASAHKKTPAQVLLRWLIQRNISAIPKSVTPKRIEENFNVFDFKLSEDEMKKLSNLKVRQRLFLQDHVAGHPDHPFPDEL